MLQLFLPFVQQVLKIEGFRASQVPKGVYQALLTAFKGIEKHGVVMISGVIALAKQCPGRLIVDDTSNPKYGLKFWCRTLKLLTTNGYASGFKIVLFLWECDWGRLPLGFALWHQHTPSLNELALRGFSQLRNGYGLKPDAVLADGAYCTDKLLALLENYGWRTAMRFKSNRKLDGVKISKLIPRGYGEAQGRLKNGVKVKVFRRKDRFYVCNRMLWDMAKLVETYKRRWKIEEVFRGLKGLLHLDGCQQHSMQAQALYVYVCFLVFTCLELHPGHSVYKTWSSVISGHISLQNLLQHNLFTF